MTAYYMSPVPDACMAVIQHDSVVTYSQDGDGVEQMFKDMLPVLVMRGAVCLYHEGEVVYMLRRRTAWVGIVDVFTGPDATIHEAVRVGRRAIAWAAENSAYHRLEARSPWPMLPVIARRLGFEIEGYRRESFRSPSGAMLDEIEVGLILRGTTCHKQH
jgi:hypothetical protein